MALGRTSAVPPLGCVMRTSGISICSKARLNSKLRRANWRAPSSSLIFTRAWISLRLEPSVQEAQFLRELWARILQRICPGSSPGFSPGFSRDFFQQVFVPGFARLAVWQQTRRKRRWLPQDTARRENNEWLSQWPRRKFRARVEVA
jgi:2-polyprenyl-6-methoxyphenol hydroxylase-like FAD-dependent oxidoreductase